MQFGVYKHMSIFQRQQIAQASRASAICSLWKFKSAYYAKLQENTYYNLLTIYRKNITESQHRQNFESVRMLFVICTLVTTLH